jgi:uncharacterized membrane protein (DUF485 family)
VFIDLGGRMSKQHYDHIRNNVKFDDLISQRTTLSWTLAVMILIVYYSFILVIAFSPALFGIPVSDGGIITWGIVIGLGVILFTFIITGIYVHRANTIFDKLLLDVVDASQVHVDSLDEHGNLQGDK